MCVCLGVVRRRSPMLQPKVSRSGRYNMQTAEQTVETVREKLPYFIFHEHKFSAAS